MQGLLADSARVIDAESGRTLTGAGLLAEVRRVGERLCALPEGVLFARADVELDGVLHYLGAFAAGRAIALIDPRSTPSPCEALWSGSDPPRC